MVHVYKPTDRYDAQVDLLCCRAAVHDVDRSSFRQCSFRGRIPWSDFRGRIPWSDPETEEVYKFCSRHHPREAEKARKVQEEKAARQKAAHDRQVRAARVARGFELATDDELMAEVRRREIG